MSRKLDSSDDLGPGSVTMFFDDVGQMMMDATMVVDSTARAGVSFAVAGVLGAAVYASALGLPFKDVLDPHAVSVMLTVTGVGLGAGFIRGLHLVRHSGPPSTFATCVRTPTQMKPDAG
jgi:hypothetical protein